MKTFVLELRQQYGEDYWTSDEPDQSSAWLVTGTAGNRVASFFVRHDLPAKFWIRVTRVVA